MTNKRVLSDAKDSGHQESQSVCKSTLPPSQCADFACYDYWGWGLKAWTIQAYSFRRVQSLGTEKPTGVSHISLGVGGSVKCYIKGNKLTTTNQ